ncbi:ferritin-like domain-containing protein [Nitrosococcus wardiae]|uniref:Ferritin-like domain-containing protein n=1 Tax=Nitrosococcus wardiae TaxID=1814290 RepID=A0A4P7BZ05_9GAMM|nr:ferritin-like domain-containing protein [Nitrosococcus wardiae]QBQ53666.1 ferritin-like domain-containing protein [Nitrosococcus wardiae]
MERSVKMTTKNKTGIAMSPMDSQAIIDAAQKMPPSSAGDKAMFTSVESAYIKESSPVGSVPPPGTLKGAAQALLDKLSGENPEVLIDKLGERLAFERTGARLYEYLITKCQAVQADSQLSIDTLRRFRDEEERHFKIVARALESLGADPTAQTPGADVSAVASMGVLQVISDPRTSVAQSMEAILTAELVDHAGWELLIQLADKMGLDEMVIDFRTALAEEDNHLRQIREWNEQLTLKQAGV